MAGDFSNASSFANMVFDTKIAPLVCAALKGGRILPVEGQMHRTLEALDMAAGIDRIHEGRHGCRGMAVRIQVGPTDWRTYTIRKERESHASTEFSKRKAAVLGEYLYPQLTLQAYVNENADVLSFALTRTITLYRLLEEQIEAGHAKTDRTGLAQVGQASFYHVAWSDFAKNGRKVYIYDGKSGGGELIR